MRAAAFLVLVTAAGAAAAQEAGRWQYIAGPYSFMLPGSREVKEQGLFRIDTKTGEVSLCRLQPAPADEMRKGGPFIEMTCTPVPVRSP